jgi:hypothetical protein
MILADIAKHPESIPFTIDGREGTWVILSTREGGYYCSCVDENGVTIDGTGRPFAFGTPVSLIFKSDYL